MLPNLLKFLTRYFMYASMAAVRLKTTYREILWGESIAIPRDKTGFIVSIRPRRGRIRTQAEVCLLLRRKRWLLIAPKNRRLGDLFSYQSRKLWACAQGRMFYNRRDLLTAFSFFVRKMKTGWIDRWKSDGGESSPKRPQAQNYFLLAYRARAGFFSVALSMRRENPPRQKLWRTSRDDSRMSHHDSSNKVLLNTVLKASPQNKLGKIAFSACSYIVWRGMSESDMYRDTLRISRLSTNDRWICRERKMTNLFWGDA